MKKKPRPRKVPPKQHRARTRRQEVRVGYIGRTLPSLLSPRGLFWETFFGAIAILTVAYTMISPDIVVDKDTSFDPKNALATVFKVTNCNKVLPIYDVYRALTIHALVDPVTKLLMSDSSWKSDGPSITANLSAGESTTVDMPLGIQSYVIGPTYFTEADMEIIISYKTMILNRNIVRRFRFEAHPGIDGNVQWTSKSIAEPLPPYSSKKH